MNSVTIRKKYFETDFFFGSRQNPVKKCVSGFDFGNQVSDYGFEKQVSGYRCLIFFLGLSIVSISFKISFCYLQHVEITLLAERSADKARTSADKNLCHCSKFALNKCSHLYF